MIRKGADMVKKNNTTFSVMFRIFEKISWDLDTIKEVQ